MANNDQQIIIDAFQNYLHSGNEEDLNSLFKASHLTVGRLAYRFFKNSADVEDIVQIFYIKIMENRLSLKKRAMENDLNILPWCITTSLNICRSEYKRRKATAMRNKNFSKIKTDSEEICASFDSAVLKTALDKLPEKYKIPLYLKYYEEQSNFDISTALEINPSTLRTNLERGLKKLRELIPVTSISIMTDSVLISQIKTLELEKIGTTQSNQIFIRIVDQFKAGKSARIGIASYSLFQYRAFKALLFIGILSLLTWSFYQFKTAQPLIKTELKPLLKEANVRKFKIHWKIGDPIDEIQKLAQFPIKLNSNGAILIEKSEDPNLYYILFPWDIIEQPAYLYVKLSEKSKIKKINQDDLIEKKYSDLTAKQSKIIVSSLQQKGKIIYEVYSSAGYTFDLYKKKICSMSKYLKPELALKVVRHSRLMFKGENIEIEEIEYQSGDAINPDLIQECIEVWNKN